ncbi:hypothetical protein VTK26DRAFT_8385 [Humicola hyalothermophila]
MMTREWEDRSGGLGQEWLKPSRIIGRGWTGLCTKSIRRALDGVWAACCLSFSLYITNCKSKHRILPFVYSLLVQPPFRLFSLVMDLDGSVGRCGRRFRQSHVAKCATLTNPGTMPGNWQAHARDSFSRDFDSRVGGQPGIEGPSFRKDSKLPSTLRAQVLGKATHFVIHRAEVTEIRDPAVFIDQSLSYALYSSSY